eukprot:GHVU01030772.1.p1 GENE.GHVU01030772.1~~GHVU01030772.1.p1  ORF type:complete len:674 (-),score=62.61 GHVU01030772.1:47-2041(-)
MASDNLLGKAQWNEVAVSLKDFSAKHPTPHLVKVTKGQYRNIGVAKSVSSELYLHSVRTTSKVLAESVKIKEGKRAVFSEQKYSLPITYQGWFELMSEDGKAIKPIQSIQELIRIFPPSALVRENTRGFVPKDTGDLSLDRMRVIQTGEALTLVGEMTVPLHTPKGIVTRRLLRCFDAQGGDIYLSYEQKGVFSPIAGQTNISGVHDVKGILEKFRLPITVRLVHGIIPSKLDKGTFTGIFRLLSVYNDETAFVMPLKKDAKMVPISTREPLKVAVAQNMDVLTGLDEHTYYQNRCNKMVTSYLNSIHVLVTMPDPVDIAKARDEIKTLQSPPEKPDVASSKGQVTKLPKEEEDTLFEEIDDIYHYVREGGKPPSPRQRPTNHSPQPSSQTAQNISSTPVTSGGISATKATFVVDSPDTHAGADLTSGGKDEENYWEEPIYVQIDKYKKSKGNKGTYDVGVQDLGMIQVENLRQVYKSMDTDTGNSPVSRQKKTKGMAPQPPGTAVAMFSDEVPSYGEEGDAPPVPPKLFERSLSDGGDDTMPVSAIPENNLSGSRLLRHSSVPARSPEGTAHAIGGVPSARQSHHQTGNGYVSRKSVSPGIGRATSVPVDSTHLIYTPTGPVVTGVAKNLPGYPHFVAVAQVNSNNGNDKRADLARKLQSMYL